MKYFLTIPFVALISTKSPSLNISVALAVPTTHGILSSRATIAT